MATINETWLQAKNAWSEITFGPGRRLQGVLAHIREELYEVEADPTNPEEWADVILLAMDGAYRHGITPERLIATIKSKQKKNTRRQWPDWRDYEDTAIGHVRGIED